VPAAQVDAVVAQVTALQHGSQQVTSGLGSLTTGAQALSTGTAQVSAGAQKLASGSTALASGTATLSTGATKAAAGAAKVLSGSDSLASGLSSLTSGATTLQQGLASGAASVPVVDSSARAATAADLAIPVTVTATNESKASTYGAGLAPFFLVLALWIGAYTLFLLVRPLSRRAIAADQRSWQVALGGWLTPAVLGAVQAVLVTLVVSLWVGVAPSNPVLTVAFMALVSVTFIAIIQALGAWLGPAGQFVALILMILQLVSSGGTFPWQTLPEPLWALHDALPMSHAIEALRQLFYGGDLSLVVSQLLVLLAYLGGALLLTTLAARRQRMWTPSRLQPAITL
jgi:putative membrane protein